VNRSIPLFLSAVVIVLTVTACTGSSSPPLTEAPTERPTQAPTEAATATPVTPVPPTAMPPPTDTPLPTDTPTEAPQLTATEEACPSDPAEWTLVPYEYPGAPVDLYTIEPVCVMEAVERAFVEFIDVQSAKGRNWTREDDQYYYAQETVTGIISGRTIYGLGDIGKYECKGWETVHSDGARYAAEDVNVVFYTAGESGTVVNLLNIVRGGTTLRIYDCDTGELLHEGVQPEVIALIQRPMVYDSELGRWQPTMEVDTLEQVEPDGIDIEALITLIRQAQGRVGP